MIRLENMLPKAFLIGLVEMVDLVGPEKTYKWLEAIGEKMGEIEGPGFEGAREDEINYLPVCPFGNVVIDFIQIYGERPPQFIEIINYSNEMKSKSEDGWKYPALTSVIGVMHFSYSRKRAELADSLLLNVGSKSPITNTIEYNDKAIEKAGMTREEVDSYLEKAYYVYKIKPLDQE